MRKAREREAIKIRIKKKSWCLKEERKRTVLVLLERRKTRRVRLNKNNYKDK